MTQINRNKESEHQTESFSRNFFSCSHWDRTWIEIEAENAIFFFLGHRNLQFFISDFLVMVNCYRRLYRWYLWIVWRFLFHIASTTSTLIHVNLRSLHFPWRQTTCYGSVEFWLQGFDEMRCGTLEKAYLGEKGDRRKLLLFMLRHVLAVPTCLNCILLPSILQHGMVLLFKVGRFLLFC